MHASPDFSNVQRPAAEPTVLGSQHPASSIRHPASTWLDLSLAFVVGLAAFLLYLRTLAPGLLWGDPGEFQFAAWLGGFAHPTGYPLYLMLGWLWTHVLPWGDPAWRMNLFSAAWGGVAVGLVFLVALRVLQFLDGARRSATPFLHRLTAFCAAAALAVAPTFWSQAVVAEVYTLHAAFVAGLLLALLTWAGRPAEARTRALYGVALLCGLSLAHHRTTLLLLPAGAAFLWLARARSRDAGSVSAPRARSHPLTTPRAPMRGCPQSEAERPERSRGRAPGGVEGCAAAESIAAPSTPGRALLRPSAQGANAIFMQYGGQPGHDNSAQDARVFGFARRSTLIALGLLLAPLLLYLYIPLAAPATPYAQLVLGPDQRLPLYRATFAGFLEQISGSTFSTALGGPGGFGAALAGLAQRLIYEFAWPGVALGLVGVAWLAWLTIRSGEASQKRNRVAWLALTLLAFLATVGFNLFYGIGDIFVFYIPVYLIWALWLSTGVWACGRAAAWAWGRVTATENRPQHVHVVLCLLALLLSGSQGARSFVANDRRGEDAARAVWESILAQPIPPNAVLVSNDRDEMVPLWYLKYVEKRRIDLDGLFPLVQPGPAWSDIAAVVERALASGRPVYLIKPMPGLEVKFDLESSAARGTAIGAVLRVLGPAEQGASGRSSTAVFGERLRLVSYNLQPAAVRGGQELGVVLHWETLAALDDDYTTFVHLVNSAGTVVGQSDHRPGGVYYPTSLWRPGDRLRDAHLFVVAADPGAGPYELEVGVYRLAPDLQHLGVPQRVGELSGGG